MPMKISLLTSFTAPRLIAPSDVGIVSGFDCGEARLNQWLQTRALVNQRDRVSSTFVSLDGDGCIAGYVTLSVYLIHTNDWTSAKERFDMDLPADIPAVLLGRLAVDRKHQGCRLGARLVKFARQRAERMSEYAAAWALVVHPKPSVSGFYERLGFIRPRIDLGIPTLIYRLGSCDRFL